MLGVRETEVVRHNVYRFLISGHNYYEKYERLSRAIQELALRGYQILSIDSHLLDSKELEALVVVLPK